MKRDHPFTSARGARALALFCLLIVVPVGAQQLAWYAMDDGYGYPRGMRMTVDPAGNSYSVGWLGTSPDMDPGPGTSFLSADASAYVRKLDPNGQFAWSVGFDAMDVSSGATPSDVSLDALGNIFVTGELDGTVDFDPSPAQALVTAVGSSWSSFVCKLDPNGAFLWAQGISSSVRASRVATDPLGNAWVSGYFYDAADFDPGAGTYILDPDGDSGFLWKLDSNGDFLWAGMLDNNSSCYVTGLSTNAGGDVFATGYTDGYVTVDYDPGPGTHIVYTDTVQSFVLKLQSDGAFAWVATVNGDGAWDIAVDSTGAVLSTGYLASVFGACDYDPGPGVYTLSCATEVPYVWKLDDAGDLVWARQLGNTGDVWGWPSITTYGEGNVIITGQSQSMAIDLDPGPGTVNPSVAGSHFFVSVLDQNGDYLWGGFIDHQGWSGTGLPTLAWAPRADATGNIYLGGIARGNTDLDPGPGVTPYSAAFEDPWGVDMDVSRFMLKLGSLPLAEKEVAPASFTIHPNPVVDMVHISTSEMVSHSTLLDLSGRPVRMFAGSTRDLNLRDLAAGVYVLDVQLASGRRTQTIVKR